MSVVHWFTSRLQTYKSTLKLHTHILDLSVQIKESIKPITECLWKCSLQTECFPFKNHLKSLYSSVLINMLLILSVVPIGPDRGHLASSASVLWEMKDLSLMFYNHCKCDGHNIINLLQQHTNNPREGIYVYSTTYNIM